MAVGAEGHARIEDYVPIEDYALIGDMQTAALVDRGGSIDWLCLPRFDSSACFAALLGTGDNGYWRLAPAGGEATGRRRYRGDSLVLETEWETPHGAVRVVDFMPPRGQAPDVVRIVEGLAGRVDMRSELRLRFEYGRVRPWTRRDDGLIRSIAGPDAVWLSAEVDLAQHGPDIRAEFSVAAGDSYGFVLAWNPSHLGAPRMADARQALRDTEAFWSRWVARCGYHGRWREAVVRSLITLKALTYAPTGGIVAAVTTSLPEDVGGVRNWDYRYCWLRDATMTLNALLRTGYVEEARAWRDWLLRAVAGDPEDVQIVYGVAGERWIAEREVDWLAGYANSRPVRVGNAASSQRQLDVFGEVMDALHLARRAGLPTEADVWRLQRALLERLERQWCEPDRGMWEVRGPARQFVHSKVMAWVAFDRAVRTVERDPRLEGPVDRWRAARDEIHDEVCAKGYRADLGTFTQSYGSDRLDAALLVLPQVGFLPADDPRIVGTVAAIRRGLCHDGLVRRYDTTGDTAGGSEGADGLPGTEGAFLPCSFWLADALVQQGRRAEGEKLFERLLGLRNDVGLLSEEWDPRRNRQVGNLPQAFTHVQLVNTALSLQRGGDTHRSRLGE